MDKPSEGALLNYVLVILGTLLLSHLVKPLLTKIMTLIRQRVWPDIALIVDTALHYLLRPIRLSLAYKITLRDYHRLCSADDRFRNMLIPGMDDMSVDVGKLYIPLTLEQSSSNTSHDPAALRHAGHRICLSGDPGSGKSTLLRTLLLDRTNTRTTSSEQPAFAVLFELKRLVLASAPEAEEDNALGHWLCEQIRIGLRSFAAPQLDKCFDYFSEGQGVLILLDGLDEVATDDFDRLLTSLKQFGSLMAERGCRNTIVITMRSAVTSYVYPELSEAYPRSFSLSPFSVSDVYEFLRRWGPDIEADDVFDKITSQPHLLALCRNPLILSMYVAREQLRLRKLIGNSRTEFFTLVCEELLIRRRLRQEGDSATDRTHGRIPAVASSEPPGLASTRASREKVLGQLALKHMFTFAESTNLIPWEHAKAIVAETLNCAPESAETALRRIGKDTGLLLEEKESRTVRFIHLSFCEFFAAKALTDEGSDFWRGTLKKIWQEKTRRHHVKIAGRLREVIPFVAGLVKPGEKKKVLRLLYEVLPSEDSIGDLRDAILQNALLEADDLGDEIAEKIAADILGTLERPQVGEIDWAQRTMLLLLLLERGERDHVVWAQGMRARLLKFVQAHRQARRMATVLTAYCMHDPIGGLLLAEHLEIELAELAPGAVIQNIGQGVFRERLLRTLNEKPQGKKRLAMLFGIAAIRSEPVGDALCKNGRINGLERYVPDGVRTRIETVLVPSLRTQCLAILCADASSMATEGQDPNKAAEAFLSDPVGVSGAPALEPFFARFVYPSGTVTSWVWMLRRRLGWRIPLESLPVVAAITLGSWSLVGTEHLFLGLVGLGVGTVAFGKWRVHAFGAQVREDKRALGLCQERS